MSAKAASKNLPSELPRVAAVAIDLRVLGVLAFGPLIASRAHPHGTFKFLFNAVYYGSAARERF